MQLYLALGTDDALPEGSFHPVWAVYRLGGRLLRLSGQQPRGGLMLVGDSDQCGAPDVLARDILRECLDRSYSGVVLDWYHTGTDRSALTAQLDRLCTQYGLRLFVPEGYAAHAPRARLLINTAVAGGTLKNCLSQAVQRFGAARLAVDLERLRLDFTLPLSSKQRRALTVQELHRLMEGKTLYDSHELCARYFTYRSGSENHYVLFDDTDTLRQKAALAESMGIREGFFMLPEIRDIPQVLTGGRQGGDTI